jgi:hypothetical protein
MRLARSGPPRFAVSFPAKRPLRGDGEGEIRDEEDDQFADHVERDQSDRARNERADHGHGRGCTDKAAAGQRDPSCPTGDRQQGERNEQSDDVPQHEQNEGGDHKTRRDQREKSNSAVDGARRSSGGGAIVSSHPINPEEKIS